MDRELNLAKELRNSIIFYRAALNSGYSESIRRAKSAMLSAHRRLEYVIKVGEKS